MIGIFMNTRLDKYNSIFVKNTPKFQHISVWSRSRKWIKKNMLPPSLDVPYINT